MKRYIETFRLNVIQSFGSVLLFIPGFLSVPLKMLSQLPDEIQLRIMSFLDCESLVKMGEVSHYFKELTQEESLWTSIDFRGSSANELDTCINKVNRFTRILSICLITGEVLTEGNCLLIKMKCVNLKKLSLYGNGRYEFSTPLPFTFFPSSIEELQIENINLAFLFNPHHAVSEILPNLKRLECQLDEISRLHDFMGTQYVSFRDFIELSAPALHCLDLSARRINFYTIAYHLELPDLQHLRFNDCSDMDSFDLEYFASRVHHDSLKVIEAFGARVNIEECHQLIMGGVRVILDSSTASERIEARRLCKYCSRSLSASQ